MTALCCAAVDSKVDHQYASHSYVLARERGLRPASIIHRLRVVGGLFACSALLFMSLSFYSPFSSLLSPPLPPSPLLSPPFPQVVLSLQPPPHRSTVMAEISAIARRKRCPLFLAAPPFVRWAAAQQPLPGGGLHPAAGTEAMATDDADADAAAAGLAAGVAADAAADADAEGPGPSHQPRWHGGAGSESLPHLLAARAAPTAAGGASHLRGGVDPPPPSPEVMSGPTSSPCDALPPSPPFSSSSPPSSPLATVCAFSVQQPLRPLQTPSHECDLSEVQWQGDGHAGRRGGGDGLPSIRGLRLFR